MSDGPLEEARDCWNQLADDWLVQVGDEGDCNRRLNSDPVLWEFAGDVSGLAVLDAGCGTGYLSCKLCARVTGVDLAERMVDGARPAMSSRVGFPGRRRSDAGRCYQRWKPWRSSPGARMRADS